MKRLCILLVFTILLTACTQAKPENPTRAESVEAASFEPTPRKDGVDAFYTALQETSDYIQDKESYYNIAPAEMKEKYGFEIYSTPYADSYISYENELYKIGGLIMCSYAVADLNGDKIPELYYTYSRAVSSYKSTVGYFDFATKKETNLKYVSGTDMMLSVSKDGKLSIGTATVEHSDTSEDVFYTPKPLAHLGTIVCEDGVISVKEPETHEETTEDTSIELDSSIVTFGLEPSRDGVSEFWLKLNAKNKPAEAGFYNITPDGIKERYGFELFKEKDNCETYLLYEDEIHNIGVGFGGFGVVSFAVADKNADGEYELYYTYSWGSGMHRSHIAYFDFASKEQTELDYVLANYDMTLAVTEQGWLGFYKAEIELANSEADPFVTLKAIPVDAIGRISFEHDKIQTICFAEFVK